MEPSEIAYVGLAEAARLTGKSIATVRRRKQELIGLGATASTKGWAIPVPALVQVFQSDRLHDVKLPADTTLDSLQPQEDTPLVSALKAHIRDLRAQLETERARADRLENRLDRLLPAGFSEDSPASSVERPGFFARLFGRV